MIPKQTSPEVKTAAGGPTSSRTTYRGVRWTGIYHPGTGVVSQPAVRHGNGYYRSFTLVVPNSAYSLYSTSVYGLRRHSDINLVFLQGI